MSTPPNFYKQILQDVAVELTDEFDRNFDRKGFFDKKWLKAKLYNRRGSLMLRTGRLRRSIQNRILQNGVTWTSSQPDASIHNEGGEITVTRQMQKFFWAKYMELKARDGIEAEQYKGMALKKVGSKITIPERRYIGDHPEVRKSIERCFDQTMNEIDIYITNHLKQK